MAVSTTSNRISYAGNGATTAFSYPYKFLANADLKVYVRVDATGAETLQTITTEYTVTGAGEDAGGTVTMLTAPASGQTLVVLSDPTATQETDLVENDSLPAEALEDSLDKLTLLVQRLKDRTDRTVRLTDGFSPSFTATLPSNLNEAANKAVTINSAGTGFADADDWPSTTDIADAAPNAALAKDWASKTNGIVDATDYSAKAWAVGGTDVTDTASRGAAKEWAIETASTVDGTNYSAKEHAQGTQTRGAAGGGSAKDWANYTGGTVDDTEYSAKHWAQEAATEVSTAIAAADLGDLNNVTETTPQEGEVLTYQSGVWVNAAPAGGGGGGGLRLIEGDNSPIKEYEAGWEYYSYEPGQGQKLFLNLHVPSTYVAGSPIVVKIKWACASTSGDALINAVATLVRAETDAYTSTTNQRTTTNAAVTVSAGTANEMQKINLDVSSSIGEVNAVAVAAGDTLKIEIQESSSTVADAIKYFFDLTEVTFS